MNTSGKYNWADPKDTEVKTCSICDKDIYGMGNNPQPVEVFVDENFSTRKLEVSESCCDDCNTAIVIPTRITENKLIKLKEGVRK